MNRLFRRRRQPLPGRTPARWTPLEVVLLLVSALLIAFPLYAEVYRWVNPSAAPAAPRQETALPAATPPESDRVPTPTTVDSTPEPTAVEPTATTTGETPTATTTGETPTATATTAPSVTPGGPTATNLPEAPLSLEKIASLAEAQRGQQFSYAISVFSNSGSTRNVQVRDTLDGRLEYVNVEPSNGSCSGSTTITCNVTAQGNQPALINITVRLRADAEPGSQVLNQALAQDDLSNTASSDQVIVIVQAGSVNPTSNPTTATTGPPPESETPTTEPPATEQPGSGGSGGSGDSGGSSGGGDESDEEGSAGGAPSPGEQVLPPAPEPGPGAVLPPTARPGGRPAPVAPARTPQAPVAPTAAAATAVAATAQAVSDGLSFQMGSDWGSVFPGQEIYYVIAVRNNLPAGGAAFTNLRLESDLPANLESLSAQSDRGPDPTLSGNRLSFSLASLGAGEGVEIGIRARVKSSVEVGTRIVSQAMLTYDGRQFPARSNIVTVLVVGSPALQSTQVPATQAPSATTPALAAATAAPPPSATTPPTVAPTAVPQANAGGAPAQQPAAAPLPETSMGLPPLFGLALLGGTLLVRTVRLRRGRERV